MSKPRTWPEIGASSWMLGWEASMVIGLRCMKIAAGGPAAATEIDLMSAEKVQAGIELATRAMSGGLGLTPETVASNTLTHYRRKVRANRRRLSKS